MPVWLLPSWLMKRADRGAGLDCRAPDRQRSGLKPLCTADTGSMAGVEKQVVVGLCRN